MIPHQHPSVHTPICFFTDIGKALQKKSPVLIIHKNRRPPIPSSHHMIKSPFKFQSNLRAISELQQTQMTSANHA